MPNENPLPRSIFAEFETVLHALSLYGAAGIAAFGWAMGWFLRVDVVPWLPLWFCAALLIYNADRLRRDPADALNVPARAAACARLRTASGITLALAVLVLIGLPAWRGDWVLLYFICGGAVISLGYSIPVLGWRWKDIPLVKTLIAPTVVTVAIFGPPMLERPGYFGFDDLARPVSWAWCYLLFNMLLCDLRDCTGDRQCGIRSIPVVFGEKGARWLLWVLAIAGVCLLPTPFRVHFGYPMPYFSVILLTGLYQACLLQATLRPRSERFYEWAVEGLLYLPALACGLALLLSHFLRDDV